MNGFVTQIIGPVIDVEFPEGQLKSRNSRKIKAFNPRNKLLR